MTDVQKARERQKAIDEIQALVDEAIASGPSEPFDFDAFIARKVAEAKNE